MQVNPTCCATAPRRQIVLNLLGSELVPSFVITCNLCCPPSLANILLHQWFSNADMPLVPYMCFYPRGCIRFHPELLLQLGSKGSLRNDHRECWADRVSYYVYHSLGRLRPYNIVIRERELHTWNHCNEYPSEDYDLVQSPYGMCCIH